MNFNRIIDLSNLRSSAFVFGPRMTGKTTLLRSLGIKCFFDLLDPDQELKYRLQPRLFWEQISVLPAKSKIIVDEIQKVPELLNYVQMGIDQSGHEFILSGSSARKLKRGSANLLGGRALDLHIHPLTLSEIGQGFRVENALRFGTLPKIHSLVLEGNTDLAQGLLRSYCTTYIKEEIQAEAIVRNIGPFQRFLAIAAQSNGQVIEFSNISRECSVPASTVKEFYQILEDTLIGFFVWPHDRNERKKARPKFFFFDCGVTRALQNRLQDPPTPEEAGFLFETWFIGEVRRLHDYHNLPFDISFWRDSQHEVDLVLTKNSRPMLAIECKSGRQDFDLSSIRAFKEHFPDTPVIVASLFDETPRLSQQIQILPWAQALDRIKT
jgi:uncharacterized protein